MTATTKTQTVEAPKDIRLLAAIMFTDIVGYTALMQENEPYAKEIRDKHRTTLEELSADHHGRILQHFGDGTLTIFGSVIEAVYCAVKIQHELQKEPVIPLRIGIHLGDIVYNDEGVYGDSVNIASRIESLSVPGGVLVSEKVYDEIRNQPDLPVVSLGTYELKNINKPMEIYALANEGLTVPSPEDVKGKSQDPGLSIAVLPFVNMSADPENEYFSDGISEELINTLAKIDGLRVMSSTTSFAFKGKNMDVRDIGTQLNVNTIIEGSVRKSGDTVRITIQLISAGDGSQFWSEVFERKLEDIFEIQNEISGHIVERLREKLAIGRVTRPLVQTRNYNLDGYNRYLMGVYHWNKWTPENVEKAIKYFESALATDPKLAPAYSFLANCYIYFGTTGYLKPKIAYPKAKEYAEKALELDDRISESHVSLAMTKLMFQWDFEGAQAAFRKAVDLNPGSSMVHHFYSGYFLIMGEVSDALREIETAIQLDPLSLLINDQWGRIFMYTGRYGDAIKQFDKTLKMNPVFRISLEHLALTYIFKEDHRKAIKLIADMKKIPGFESRALALAAYARAKAGKLEKAKWNLRKLKKIDGKEPDATYSYYFALIYAGLGETAKMFEYLDIAVEERLSSVLYLALHPEWKPYRNNKHFRQLLTKIGLKLRRTPAKPKLSV